MRILDYTTSGGKNLIMEYIVSLPKAEQAMLLDIRREIRESGICAFDKLKTRQLRGKLYEIKASDNRIMYVIQDAESVVFLHVCRKQKGKAEKHELNKALRRAKEEGLL